VQGVRRPEAEALRGIAQGNCSSISSICPTVRPLDEGGEAEANV
jgi:hypothetical protein